MNARLWLALFLTLSPVIACFVITPPGDAYQGNLPFTFSVKTNLTDDTAYLDSVELIFDRPMNLTSLATGTCLEEKGDLCKRVSWSYNDAPLTDEDESFFTVVPDFCLSNGTMFEVRIIANGKCPDYRYEERLYSDAFGVNEANNVACGPFHQVEATLANVSIYAYYRPLGGNATLYVSGAGSDETVTNFDEKCTQNACGLYEWHTQTTSLGFGFRTCAEANSSELIVGQGQESVRAWWKFSSYNKTSTILSKSIRVYGRPIIQTIWVVPESGILEQQNMVFRAGVGAVCGDIDSVEIGLDTSNITCFYSQLVKGESSTLNVTFNRTCEVFKVTSPNVTMTLNNTDSKWAEFSIYTSRQGEANFAVYGAYYNFTGFKNTTNFTVDYNPLRCDDGFQRCGTSCQEVPNCTRPCSLGFICKNDQDLACVYRACGNPCPNEPGKYCDGQGYCLPPQLQGYPCECKQMCLPSYLEGDTCLHSVSCEGTCRYITRQCSGTCTNSGCCGDGFCDAGENCQDCPGDCACDDKNECTIDTCVSKTCMHQDYPCGTTCSSGLCNGMGSCRSNSCCTDNDCNSYQCKSGTCSNFTCSFQYHTCESCTNGWCSQGECTPFIEFDKGCDCDVSCGAGNVCKNGRCSLCGNHACDANECYTCVGDCDLGVCAQIVWEEHGMQIVIGTVLIIFVAWYVKGLLPQIMEMMRKSKKMPPDQY